MSIATVHYLSMNARDGSVTVPGTVTEAVSASFTFSNLVPSTQYTVDWGDAGATSTPTTNASGTVTTTHTYAAAGDYTITVTLGGVVKATADVTVTA